MGVLLCEMGCASLDQAATGKDCHFFALHHLGCSVSGSPVCSPLRSGPLGRGAVGGRMGLPGFGRGSWWSEALPVGRTRRLCVLVSPIWVPLDSRLPGALAVVWGPWSGEVKPALLRLSSSSPTPPPCLVRSPSCFLLTPLPALPAHLGWVRRPRSGCELISFSLGVAVGQEGEVTPFCLVLWLTPSRSSTHSPAPRTPGHPLSSVHGHSGRGPPSVSVSGVSSVSPCPAGLRMWGAYSTTWHHRAQSGGWAEAVPTGTLLPLCSAWPGSGLWSQGWSALGGHASKQALSLGEPQFSRVPASPVM